MINKKQKKVSAFELFFRITKALGILALIGSALVFYLFFYYSKDLPDYTQLENYYPPATTRIYSSDGKLMEEFALEHRIFVPIRSIPKFVTEAFIAAEDRNFYTHPGVDVFSIIRSLFQGITKVSQGKRMAGGSTITQQVVKNFLLTSERSLERKIKEAILSYMISKTFSKDRILELYLNQVFLGKRAYGVASAAQIYFDKSLDELTIAEIAYITALSKAPSTYDPAKNYERSKARRDYVINRMFEEGYIDKKTADEALNQPIKFAKREKSETVTAPYFVDQIRSEVIHKLGQDALYMEGLTIISTLNPEYQQYAENALIYGIREYDMRKGYRGPLSKMSLKNWQEDLKNFKQPEALLEYNIAVVLGNSKTDSSIGFLDGTKSSIPFGEMKWASSKSKLPSEIIKPGDIVVVTKIKDKNHYGLRQIPEVNGATMAINPYTGQVLALVGGYSYDKNKFNRATQATRQPGSAFKPLVYLAALENGIKPNAIYSDSPVEIYQGPFLPAWKPKNYKGDFLGPLTVRSAFEKSRNTVTIKIANQIGISKVVDIAKRFGVNKNPPKYYSMALGSLETTLDRMTNSYAMMMNGGKMIKPYFIEVIKDRNGHILYKRDHSECTNCLVQNIGKNPPLPEMHKEYKFVTDERSAYQITSLLIGATQRGRAAAASAEIGKIIGGKTGTTNDSKDAWFIGFSPNIVSGTYIGFDNPKDMGKRETGSSVAMPVFVHFMKNALKNKENLDFIVPEGITFKKIDPVTGQESDSPKAIFEAFKSDLTPNQDKKIERFSSYEDEYDKEIYNYHSNEETKNTEKNIPIGNIPKDSISDKIDDVEDKKSPAPKFDSSTEIY
jgi:penicillin-binding protein 1A